MNEPTPVLALDVVERLDARVRELEAENDRLRSALEALYDDWTGPMTDAAEQARQVLYGAYWLVASPAAPETEDKT